MEAYFAPKEAERNK